MASTSKTEHYALNSWVGTDKPQRADFNEDNRIIDTALYNHVNDMTLHTTLADKRQNQILIYMGNGSNEQVLQADFEPDGVIIMPVSIPAVRISGTIVYCHSAATAGNFNIGSVSINGREITVKQEAPYSNNCSVTRLNESGEYYAAVVFRANYDDE